mmetsp:Transcript_18748/g.34556  ORF Transcript_18748/g.34556 Transcript_18748/m.34556 type:complete len:216 (-) Transcript_18748:787-1434(-)
MFPTWTIGGTQLIHTYIPHSWPGFTLIQQPQLLHIPLTQFGTLSHRLPIRQGNHGHNRGESIGRKRYRGIVHNAVEIVRTSEAVHHEGLLEVIFGGFANVVPVDGDVVVSIGTGVFMPKSQCMQQLMNNIPQMTTTLTPSQIHIGLPPRLLPKIRSTNPLVMHLMIKVNIFHLIRALYELNDARRLFNVLQGQLDGGECFGVEPGGVGFDGVGYV